MSQPGDDEAALFSVRQFKGSVRFLCPSLKIGHVHLSCSVSVKYHSHRIISNHELPGAAVCAWPGTKLWHI